MTKIELTPLQVELANKQMNGEYSPFFATAEDQEAYNEIIDKAEALMDETGEDCGDDLLAWFMDKYNAQNAE